MNKTNNITEKQMGWPNWNNWPRNGNTSFPQPKETWIPTLQAGARCHPGRMFIWKSSYLDTSWRNFRTPKEKEKILKASRGKQNKAVYLQRSDLEWDVPRVSLSLAAGTSGFNLKLYPSSATRVLCSSWASCHEETTPDNFWGPFQLRSAADSCC